MKRGVGQGHSPTGRADGLYDLKRDQGRKPVQCIYPPSRARMAAQAPLLTTGALAQEWAPTKAVRIIVPIVGGTNDIIARIVAPELQKVFGQPVVVENRGGGGGNIGADMVAKSAPDGYTLLVGYNGPIAVNVTLFKNLPYDPLKDLTPIILAVTAPQFLAVHPTLPVKNVAEFFAYAKANRQLSYASVAVHASHLTMEMLKSTAHIDIVPIPYRDRIPRSSISAAAGERSSSCPATFSSSEGRRARVIASTGQKRFDATPDVADDDRAGPPTSSPSRGSASSRRAARRADHRSLQQGNRAHPAPAGSARQARPDADGSHGRPARASLAVFRSEFRVGQSDQGHRRSIRIAAYEAPRGKGRTDHGGGSGIGAAAARPLLRGGRGGDARGRRD